MSEESTPSDAPAEAASPPSPAQIRDMLASLPEVRIPFDAAGCLERAKKLSTRGKLPGFEDTSAAGPGLFTCAAFGAPFDYRLIVDHWQIDDTKAITFRAERLKKLPTIYAVVLALTVWPGVVFTDSLLNTWFGWYPNQWWFTWAWYIPLTLFPIPWVWRSLTRKSRAAALGHAYEQIERLTAAMDGEYMDQNADADQAEGG